MANKQFDDLTVIELKAIGYDLVSQLENIQMNLKKINVRIIEVSKQEKVVNTDEKVKNETK